MKKIFTLFCAFALAIGASMAQTAPKTFSAKEATVALEQVRNAQSIQLEKAPMGGVTLKSEGTLLEPMQSTNFNQAVPAKVMKASSRETQVLKVNNPQTKMVFSAKQAKADLQLSLAAENGTPQELEAASYETNSEDLPGETLIFLYTSSKTFCYGIEGDIELDKEYTFADMDAYYTYWYTNTGYKDATDATFKMWKENDLIHISATMVDTGNDEYIISYIEPEARTEDVVIDEYKLQDYSGSTYGNYYFTLTDNETGNIFYFDVYFDEEFEYGHSYTVENDGIGTYDSGVRTPGGIITIKDASFSMTLDEDKLVHIVASMTTATNVTYNITYDEKPFTPSGVQIDVNGTNLSGEYISSRKMFVYTADWGEYTVQLAFNTTEEKETYKPEDANLDYCLFYKDNNNQIAIKKLASDITVKTEGKTKTLTGSVYAKNGDEYILNLVYVAPDVEEIAVMVEDAKLTKSTLFFHVDGNDTEMKYGVTLYIYSKKLEGEFTVDDIDVYSSGLTDLSVKKWFDIDSCQIVSTMLGSNTLLLEGILHTSNKQLDRLIDAQFVMTARVDKNGELMNTYGAIVSPAKGDTLSFTRSDKGTAFYKNASGSLTFAAQSGKTTMIAVNDSAYYWYNPISKFTTGYWIKGLKDKEANAIVFNKDQVIQIYNGGLLGQMGWIKVTAAGSISTDLEYSDVFALDIVGAENDSLVLRGSAPFDFTQDIHFPGVYVNGYGFQSYGDAGTKLAFNKPITERDTIDIISNTMYYNDFIASNQAVQYYAGEDAEGYSTFLVTSKNATSVEGTFDIYLGYSFANTDEGNQIGFEQGQFTVASEEKGIRLTGWVIGDDEKYYRLNWYKQTVFDERDTVKVNSSTLSTFYQESIQGYVYQSSNADYELIQFVTKSSEKLGTFKFSDLQAGYTIFRTNDGDYVEFQDGEITVSEDEEGLKLTGLLIGKDEKAYVINIIQPAGTLESDTDAPFDDAFDYTDMSASINEGTITITAVKSGLSQMKLVLYTDPAATEIPEGTYTISDSKEAGTALQSTGYGATGATPCYTATLVKIDGTTYLDDMWFMVEGSVTLSYDEYGKLKVEVDAKNSYNQPVTALVKYEKIEPKGTVTIEANTLQIYDDLAESYGVYEYYAENENYAIDLYADSETPDGTFDETNIEFGACTIYDAEGNEFGVFEGEFTVTLNGKNSTLTGSVLGKDTILYELNLKGFQGAIPGDAQEAFTATYSTEDISDAFSSKAKMHVLSACNEAGDSIHIVFKSSQDPLEARTYEITTSGSMNTVIASDGTATSLNAVSFAAKKNDGEIDQLWHMVSGTVVIGEDGSITVNALNSYDQTITINVNVPLPDYYLQNYSNELYLGWNGSSTDQNKIAMMEEADRMAVALTLTDAEKKQFTVSVTATDEKPMYLSLGTGFNFKTYADSGEQGHGYLYEIEDINKSQLVANKVSEPTEGNFYLIVYGYQGSYSALGGKVTDTSGSGKMRILGYTLKSADDQLTVAFSDIQDYIYRYVTATTPAPEPRPTEEPVVEGNILDEESFNFNGGTVGQWKSAGAKTAELSTVAPGYNNSAYAMKVTTATGGANYDTQVKYVGQYVKGHTYSYSFKAKASQNVNMQVALQQDGGSYLGDYSMPIALTTEWAEYSGKLTVSNDGYVRFLLNVGETAADYFFDQIVLIDETATSVMPLMMNNDDAIYTVSGQRVIEPVKGEIYIINGQQTLFE